jgi:hypothetical protein
MEPFEQIRVSAARLHAQLVAKGADPLKPLEIVDAAIQELNLELAWLPKGHPALKGARALFDDQGGAVLCEASPDAGDRAQLAAHEIGHASIHAGSSSCTANDIDASR